ncbi:hypothetical protein ACEPAF_5651 [Sanghuangporus sanghuang]
MDDGERQIIKYETVLENDVTVFPKIPIIFDNSIDLNSLGSSDFSLNNDQPLRARSTITLGSLDLYGVPGRRELTVPFHLDNSDHRSSVKTRERSRLLTRLLTGQ